MACIKCQPYYFVPNILKMFLETMYTVFLALLFDYLIYKVIYSLYLFLMKKYVPC